MPAAQTHVEIERDYTDGHLVNIERQYSSMSKAQCAADRIGQNMIAKGILKPTRLDVHPHDGCQWIVERI